MALEFMGGSHELGDAGCKGEAFSLQVLIGTVLVVVLDQFGLVVEEVQVWRRAGHMEVDDTLCLGGGVGLSGLLGPNGIYAYIGVGVIAEQAGQGDAAKPDPAGSQKLPPGSGL